MIGRQAELTTLTDWVKGQREWARVAVLAVVALGGMGKSALTWHWFRSIAKQEWPDAHRGPLQGRLWWSFHETDAHFENFVLCALAYVLERPKADICKELPSLHEQSERLLQELDKRPFLVVLDGLDCILAGSGLPAEQFLRRLAELHKSRVLLSSQLFPSNLRTITGQYLSGSRVLFLAGLSEDDALDLWRRLDVRGSREQMLPVFDTFDRHPLFIQVLAGVVTKFRDAPGDFDAWRKANSNLPWFGLPVVQVSHILEHALRGLTNAHREVLDTVAAFRVPVDIATLRALFVGDGQPCSGSSPSLPASAFFQSFGELDRALTALEDRGLLGWDRRANRYDLHMNVRSVIRNCLDEATRVRIYSRVKEHFQAMPKVAQEDADSIDDLTPSLELYHTLVVLRSYDEAWSVFSNDLRKAMWYRFSAARQVTELLQQLIDATGEPILSSAADKAEMLHVLAHAHDLNGLPQHAVPFYRRAAEIADTGMPRHEEAFMFCHYSGALRQTGALYEAERAARQGVLIYHQLGTRCEYKRTMSFRSLGLTWLVRNWEEPMPALRNFLSKYAKDPTNRDDSASASAYCLAVDCLRWGEPKQAQELAETLLTLAKTRRQARDFVRALCLLGEAALKLNNQAKAQEHLASALEQARRVGFIQGELGALVSLACLHHMQRPDDARQLLDQVWESAERGPYRLFHADALNVLARIEREDGRRDAAVAAATEAYRKAWCDGPPYAYHWGLQDARQLLAELGAAEPELPPFDPSRYPPMPEIELDPPDPPGDDDVAQA